MQQSKTKKRNSFRLQLLIIGIAIIISARIAAPFYIQRYVNNRLDSIPEYSGSIGEVTLSLWRGAYSVKNVELNKTQANLSTPFFKSEKVDLSMQWRAIFEGALVGELYFDKAELNFVTAKKEDNSQLTVDSAWISVVESLFPFQLNHFSVIDSKIRYLDRSGSKPLDILLKDVSIYGENFGNIQRAKDQLFATVQLKARTEHETAVTANATLDPSTSEPTFLLDLTLETVSLKILNEFLIEYAAFDVESGTFNLFSELAAKDGRLSGYVKPVLLDVEILSIEGDTNNILQPFWESLVTLVSKIFTNHRKDQIAARIPIEGSFADPEAGAWAGIVSLVKNAFVEALKQAIDGDITLDAVVEGEEAK